MSVNAYADHVLVLPEDDANRELTNGFLQEPALNPRAIQVLPVAHGWIKVLSNAKTYFYGLREYPKRHLVLLVDFDGHVVDRLQVFKTSIPEEVSHRVYLLGTQDEPESLRNDCGLSLEKIGEQLASACAHGEEGLWSHRMLRHNQPELDRLMENVRPFLFDRPKNQDRRSRA